MYFDETPVVTIAALLHLCDASRKYYRYGTNHWAAFQALRKNDSDLTSMGSYLDMTFPKNQPPKELIETIQSYMASKRISNETIRTMLVKHVPHHVYLAKYTLTNRVQLRREFERFKAGVVKAVNARSKQNGGIRMLLSRPVKQEKKPSKKSSKISRGSTNAPAGNARGYAYGGPVV